MPAVCLIFIVSLLSFATTFMLGNVDFSICNLRNFNNLQFAPPKTDYLLPLRHNNEIMRKIDILTLKKLDM